MSSEISAKKTSTKTLAWFFVLALGITYALILGLPAAGIALDDAGPLLILVIGAPSIAALLVAALTEGRQGVSRLLRKYVQWRVNFIWYIIAALIFFVIGIAALLLNVAIGGLPASILQDINWFSLLPSFLIGILGPGMLPALLEELGWRGYAQSKLQTRLAPWIASLLVGIFWYLWHVPGYLTGLIDLFPSFVSLFFWIVGAAILMAWVYNKSKGSVLLMILMHGASNAVWGFLPLLPNSTGEGGTSQIFIGLVWVLALTVLVMTRGQLGFEGGRK